MSRLIFSAAAAAFLVFGAPCGFAQSVPSSGDYSGLIDIGGRRLLLQCSGTGSPTVILISGYRNNAEIWSVETAPGQTTVYAGVARVTRVCAYDRPGTLLDQDRLSRSDAVAMPRTAEAVVEELHALLATTAMRGPYVFVAHSLGGLFARLYASTYPDDVAGLVLVDAWQEDLPELLGAEQWRAYIDLAGPPPPGLEGYTDLESIDFGMASTAMRRAAEAHPLARLPLAVISRARPVALPPNVPASFSPSAFEAAWRAGQDRLAAIVPGARHLVAEKSDHYVQLSEPELVIGTVGQVVEAVRDPKSWGR